MIIETIQLLHRPTDEVIPIIKPMLAPGASITGTGYKLIIKSTPDNISQIQSLLEEIDVNQNMLRVSVSMEDKTDQSKQHGSVSIQHQDKHGSIEIGENDSSEEAPKINNNSRAKFDARIYQTNKSRNKPTTQVMSVAEGYWATIAMGQSIPVGTRTRNADGTVTESITYKQVMTGYRVKPRTHGDNVTLTIQPINQEVSSTMGGAIDTNALETTVTGKLGEWIFLGGTDHEENLKNSGITYQTRIRSTDINQVWVKVERP